MPYLAAMEHIRQYVIIALLAIIALLLLGNSFSAPYNLNYAFKRVFYKETAVCSDGTYSFTDIPKNMCDGHGRIVERLP